MKYHVSNVHLVKFYNGEIKNMDKLCIQKLLFFKNNFFANNETS